ncbi:hypothetical protein DSO57_1014220 [Entomophthora muscae]|uniref:Uncharacterized protein n=1 Tax=Entomophthora muscae TaxID=34485 RepID=A0ACC2SUI3_9FUNG|nr:hypothetical protein DSO57_1014220 [Entomophthora muscae]
MNSSSEKVAGGFKLQPPPSQGGASGSRPPRGRRARQGTESSLEADKIILAPADLTMHRDKVHSLFQSLSPKDGTLSAAVLVPLFRKSNLPTNLLREIWYLSDANNKGHLNEEEFDRSLKLIALAQNGVKPSLEALAEAGGNLFPSLEGVELGAILQPPPLASGSDSIWNISASKKEQFASAFFDLDPEGEYLDGLKARDSFISSGLSVEKLGQIWSLVDSQERGKLNLAEFLIAMHLIDLTKSGKLLNLPAKVPLELIRSVSQACGVAETTLVQPKSQSPEFDWSPTSQQIEKIQSGFSDLPKAANEEVSAKDCVGYFTNSGLPKEVLAQIWELVNVRDAGSLNSKEFLVAMVLIHGSLSGKALPLSLPRPLQDILQSQPIALPPAKAPFELKDLGVMEVVVQPELISDAIAGDVLDYTSETRTRLTVLLKELKDMHYSVQTEVNELESANTQKRTELNTLVLDHRIVVQQNYRLQAEKLRLSNEVSLLNDEIENMEAQCQTFLREESNFNTEKLTKHSRIELGFLGYNMDSASKCHQEINSLLTQLGQPTNPPPQFLT